MQRPAKILLAGTIPSKINSFGQPGSGSHRLRQNNSFVPRLHLLLPRHVPAKAALVLRCFFKGSTLGATYGVQRPGGKSCWLTTLLAPPTLDQAAVPQRARAAYTSFVRDRAATAVTLPGRQTVSLPGCTTGSARPAVRAAFISTRDVLPGWH